MEAYGLGTAVMLTTLMTTILKTESLITIFVIVYIMYETWKEMGEVFMQRESSGKTSTERCRKNRKKELHEEPIVRFYSIRARTQCRSIMTPFMDKQSEGI